MNSKENTAALEAFFIKWAEPKISFNDLKSIHESNYIRLLVDCGPKGRCEKNYYIYDEFIPVAGIFESLEVATQCLDEFLNAVNHPEWTGEGMKAAVAALRSKVFEV
jgi:hypothetical protein